MASNVSSPRVARGHAGERYVGLPVPVPRGQFRLQKPAPHSPQGGVFSELMASLTGDPGLREAHTTSRGSRTFSGSLDTVQRYTRPSSPNVEGLQTAPLQAFNQRRALSRTRGRPGLPRGA